MATAQVVETSVTVNNSPIKDYGHSEDHAVDCSQSPIFSWDCLDVPRLTVTAILIFKCTEGAGVGDYSSRGGGGGGGEKKFF